MTEFFFEYILSDDEAREIDGVDFCSVALTLGSKGEVPEFEHVQSCPCCLTGLRIVELMVFNPGIEPYEEDEAMELMDMMIDRFDKRNPGNDSTEYRRFFVTLGGNQGLRSMFKTMVAIKYRPDLIQKAPYSPDYSTN